MMTMIGIISLAGIVVNNAIVLIDYTNLLRNRKKRALSLGKFDRLLDRYKASHYRGWKNTSPTSASNCHYHYTRTHTVSHWV